MKTSKQSPHFDAEHFQPLAGRKVPRFSGLPSFNRLPYHPEFQESMERGTLDIAVIGAPWDGGTTYRPGSRFAPRSIREASVLNRNFESDLKVSVFTDSKVADCGDVFCNPIHAKQTYQSIESSIRHFQGLGTKTLLLGGDHSVLLPELRGLKKVLGKRPFTLIHFDAHTDAADQAWGEKIHHGTPVRRAIEEKLVDGSRIFQIGIRGPWATEDQEDFAAKAGVRALDMSGLHSSKKSEQFFDQIFKTAKKDPCFVTFDIDFVDPAFAPGTGTPVVGGPTSFETLRALRRLHGLEIIGSDLVEVSPAYDTGGITSLLAAAVGFELLALMA